MKILVIGDIHNHVETVNTILNQEYDKAIFLGDYFDSFGDQPLHASKTALWLKDSLRNPKHIHLMGNHDAPYRFPVNQYLECPGYTLKKQKIISEVMKQEDWKKIKLVHFEGDFMFTHAGLDSKIAPVCAFNGLRKHEVISECENLLNNAHKHFYYEWLGPRGLLWARPWDDFTPISGITQVVGHTPTWMIEVKSEPIEFETSKHGIILPNKNNRPKKLEDNYGTMWYMDSLPEYYGVLEDGELRIENSGIPKVLT